MSYPTPSHSTPSHPLKRPRRSALVGVLSAAVLLLISVAPATPASAQTTTETPSALEVAQAFMQALGGGDLEALDRLMADDMVWHNEGDTSIPWIGPWRGKQAILKDFLPAYGAGAQTKMWTVDHASEAGDQAVMTGRMSLLLTASGLETGPTSWAVQVRVRDGQVVLWHWFEDSFLFSRTFHGKATSSK